MKKTHEEFLDDLYRKNEHFKNGEFSVVGTYVSNSTPIACECPIHGVWKTSVPNNLLYGNTGCPQCAKSIISEKKSTPKKGNSLEEKYPDIALEWIYEKNGSLKPSDVSFGSHKKIWFRCSSCNYEWQTTVNNRVYFGCPRCANESRAEKQRLPNGSLQDNYPGIAKEFDLNKNNTSPNEIAPTSNEEYWWKCLVCGHEWKAVVVSRTKENSRCPKCSAKGTSYGEQYVYWAFKQLFPNSKNRYKLFGYEYDIVVIDDHGEILALIEYSGENWHKGKEAYDEKKRNMAISKGYSFFNIVETYSVDSIKATGNDYFYRPIIKNQDSFLNQIIEMILNTLSHSLSEIDLKKVKINATDYSKGTVEYEKSLEYLFPDIAQEWDYELNYPLTPRNVTAFSSKRVHWRCKNNHKWEASIGSRTSKSLGCKYCSMHSSVGVIKGVNDLITTNPDIIEYWDYKKNKGVSPDEVSASSKKRVWWKCPKCGYEWEAIIKNKSKSKNCPKCAITIHNNNQRSHK